MTHAEQLPFPGILMKYLVSGFVSGIALLVTSCAQQPATSIANNQGPAPVIYPEANLTAAAKPPPKTATPASRPVETENPATVTAAPEPQAPNKVEEPIAVATPKKVARVETEKQPPAPPPPPPPPTTSDLLGLDPVKIRSLLGNPGLVRRESPAEVWQYAGQTCVLHVFLYADQANDALTVDHLEATDMQGASTVADPCLAGLVSQ